MSPQGLDLVQRQVVREDVRYVLHCSTHELMMEAPSGRPHTTRHTAGAILYQQVRNRCAKKR
jgi:hypothetical protein